MSTQRARLRIRSERAWYERLAPSVRRAENRLARAVAADARRYVGVDTGTLRKTIRVRGNKVTAGGPRASYWYFHHEGTRPHVIEPRFKQALYWPEARHPVARVKHPGTKANPFLKRALYTKRTLQGVR
ncbi:hypothetical protein ACWFMI_23550 [Nocardiopsis terrae]|uniref:HK97 gp10 family phage protein n=1 Tax=Streptomyces sp. NPDC057554 TaxID=3350538 RepID=UPI0036886053